MSNKIEHLKSFACFIPLLVSIQHNSFGNKSMGLKEFAMPKQDSFGIPISIGQFDSIVNILLVEFRSVDHTKSISDFINFIRAVNTIEFDGLIEKNKSYYELRELFHEKYFTEIIKITEANQYHMAYYSEKYQIEIGGKKTDNNFYRIIYGQANNGNNLLKNSIDTFGILITQKRFDSLADEMLIKFRSDTTKKSIGDYIEFIKVTNTIGFWGWYEKRKEYLEIVNLFNLKYLDKAIEITDAKDLGLSYYSEKYKLEIGGKMGDNSFYKVIK